ncbi:MAG: hypothetical protein M9910_08465 [Kiritimatiellae bacterium]|nr:hypothetical protein [Kiritimatiellia bacterium]
MVRFVATALLLASLNSLGLASSPSESVVSNRFSTILASRNDLNKPLTPFKLYVAVSTSGGINDRYIKCIVLKGKPVSSDVLSSPSELQEQVIPDSYTWRVIGRDGSVERQWLSHFMKNRDGTYHTIVKLLEDELRRSRLELLIEDIEHDGQREDVRIVLDLSNYDWRSTTSEVWQDDR